ncbi:glutamine--fructose-6-phosphate aminotransferase [Candidatus Falkowbacteria bacterium RIFOXYB2_FULL_34_18]|uniref:Glutamine--fructose-6-phosphate aminotransferase [isomerizing] n=1 Tax=Candidatus Falkowbacteria bacterium RIFOXYD2_FULL_34_120 TaxID=1798007 RepID=A0A1F5TS02_9BACT|nr:MAG: glutamine--fructose-6-phosphate aminotransferase [Candidatus Falkowbacteria bacterium RIFOXYB2_FULL_34_18]OGF29844.1 MAG: glutamine--fructose-6-phosphate aminotransferase [Candidatus Falkowbacteria bacterium RIFOXYC12_FULL_34_55]OGF37085.1 MAG: glutamine--fructose-6-phosphate aminotransferase [Candidatus Falkowbacteria bacterium RIFOXYC2_FULL_34_220]OGF39277.1 MAG: glutamine--fructose-6-phosphate aminotransferase [Candidatus Falkowbacteria bacterium RIFOXYD12_FULL_34_57]OGF41381.1 MAG: 
MCGIVGYIGKNRALPILLDGLRRLEYRGYDSSGIVICDDIFHDFRVVGKIKELDKKIANMSLGGNIGIAHTRWATHGAPTENNAHPHCDCTGNIRVVHNGIIENHSALRKQLERKGHIFKSQTDTEVVPHLLEDLYKGNITETLKDVLRIIKGTYGLAVLCAQEPEKILVARKGSPLVIGIGKDETIIASDVSAILQYTKEVIYLEDGEMAEIYADHFKIFDSAANEVDKNIERIEWDIDEATKKGFDHFMLKEIFEQPSTITDSIRGRVVMDEGKVKLGGLEICVDKLRGIKRIIIIACGTAWHAGLIGEYMIEEYAGIPVEVEWASEFRYRKPILDKKTAVLVISQSGETADTLAALREAREKGALTLGIVNTVGSTIARETDAGVYNHIGPEISVASTKAFTSQVSILALLTVLLGRQRGMSLVMGQRILKELQALPEKIENYLSTNNIKDIARKYYHVNNFAFLGRKYNQPTALEGALKLKEISYIHAEGFPSGEMKHGSIAMIEPGFPSFFIAPRDSVYEKNVSNIEEIKSRGGNVIVITTEGNKELEKIADDVIYIPKTLEMLTPILASVPLQLFAYYVSSLKGLDVDKPRNLAKSVTVE